MPSEIASPLGCGIQIGAGAVINALHPEPGSSMVIFGAGAVGLAALMAARTVGCWTIIAVDILDNRCKIAHELGATYTINPGVEDAVERIIELLRAQII